jgi:hypothetical protein
MSIPEAYCVEVDAVIDIEEAQRIWAAGDRQGDGLTFLCPDERCRAATRPRIVGVNYTKRLGIDSFVQRPHFKFSQDPHIEGCPWIDHRAVLDELDRDPKLPRIRGLKRSELITAFDPRANADAPGVGEAEDLARIVTLPDRAARRKALREHLRQNFARSSILAKVVRCFEAMSRDEMERIPLTLAGRRSTYRRCFTSVQFCAASEQPNRIYYGWARVRRLRTGYGIQFAKRPTVGEGARAQVWVFVPDESLNAHGFGMMSATLMEASRHDGPSIRCYAFGAVMLHPQQDGREARMEVRPATLHSLAVTLTDDGANDENARMMT